ncbi:MAG: hypothetical protein ACTHOG_04855 [Marmoricola sp.]
MNKVLIGAVSVVAATMLTACGSSPKATSTTASTSASPTVTSSSTAPSTGGSGADAVKALVKAEILKNQRATAANPFRMSDAQAGCTANAIVDALGVHKLHAYGLITADDKLTGKRLAATKFSVADATAVVNALFSCVGNGSFTDLMKREINARLPATLPAAQRACIAGKLTVPAVKHVLIAELSGQADATAQLTTAIEACMRQ